MMFTEVRQKAVWTMVVLTSLPMFCLRAQAAVFAGGTGEPNDPYQIATASQLTAIGSDPNLLNKHYELTANIDLTGLSFAHATIGFDVNEAVVGFQGTGFSGTFNGRGHRIYNLTIAGEGYLGLFGRVAGGIITDLALKDVAIVGKDTYTGALVGESRSGAVVGCCSTGSVAGTSYVGGLVGSNGGQVANCYSRASVAGGSALGGLVGYNDAALSNCYSTGPVSGTSDVGGLVGSKSVGATDAGCFWDTATSRQTGSSGGLGLSTDLLERGQTYLLSGWDWVGEAANGTVDVWWIDEGKDYPRLRWEREVSARLPVIELDSKSFDAQIATGVILVDFFATWCPHCAVQAPILEEVADRLQGRARVAKLDVDQASGIAQRYKVKAIPTLIVFKEGLEVSRFVGVTSADVLVPAVLSAVEPPGIAAAEPRPVAVGL